MVRWAAGTLLVLIAVSTAAPVVGAPPPGTATRLEQVFLELSGMG